MKQILIILIMFSFFSCNKLNKTKTNKEDVTNNVTKKETEELRFFGIVTLSNARDYEVENVKINDNSVTIDLNFDGEKINPKSLEGVHHVLNNVENIEKNIKAEILGYIDQDGMVKEYFKFHVEEIEAQELDGFLKDTDKNLTKELRLFSKLKLHRIGFYPDLSNSFAVFDYRVAIELSDEILVVLLNRKGEIEKITIES